MQSKIGRNDKCPCNSTKKYKNCCLIKDEKTKANELRKYVEGQSISSDNVQICLEYLQEEYTDHKVIDITDDLTSANYRTYQIKNYTSKVIMVAEKTTNSTDVFTSRGSSDNDMIVMYRGSYRVFTFTDIEKVTESIDTMIQRRLAGEDDK